MRKACMFGLIGLLATSGCDGNPGANAEQPGSASTRPGGQTVAAQAAKTPAMSNTGGAGAPASNSMANAPASPPSSNSAPNAQPSQAAMNTPANSATPTSNECGLNTKWLGDELCIKPPPPDKGFQIHIGPSNYDNPEPQYVLEPNQETNMSFPATSGNDKDVYYYWRQYRMRPGSHHMIVTATSGGGGVGMGFGVGKRLGGSQNHSRDNPENGVIPPENQDVGIPLSAKTPISINLHYINLTDKPLIQEGWVNFWYKDSSTVKETALEMYSMGGLQMAIQPGEHTVLGPYSCAINTPGRLLSMYGHRHANALRFSTWRVRGGQRTQIYEDYDWTDPTVLEFNTAVTNRPPDPASKTGGGWSGVLDLQAGDTLEWECEVDNTTNGVLRFTNETVAGEMCILIGDAVGPSIMCNLP